ncbi:MAG: response regulator [Alphaproteobacteria bacterium]|nr:response regulator [Alphaproteobacteria bacterium]
MNGVVDQRPGAGPGGMTNRFDRLSVAIVGFALAVLAVLWVSIEGFVAAEIESKVEDAKRVNANLARVFEEHTARTFEYLEELLTIMVRRFESEGRELDLAARFRELRPNQQIVINSLITDAAGNVILGSHGAPAISLADREHVAVHFGRDLGHTFIGKPVQARVNRQWSLILSRRANNPDGSLRGVVMIAVNPFYFSGLYSELDLGPSATVSLIGADGVIRASREQEGASIGRDLSASESFRQTYQSSVASFVRVSPIDGMRRIFASRRMAQYPMLVVVGTTYDWELKDVHGRARTYRIAAGLVSLLIVVIPAGFIAFNAWRQAAQRRWLERLREAIENLDSGFCLYDRFGRVEMHNAKFVEPYVGLRGREILGWTMADLAREVRAHGGFPDVESEAEFDAFVDRSRRLLDNPPATGRLVQTLPGLWTQTQYRRTADGGLVSIRSDVTQLKEQADSLRKLADDYARARLIAESADHAKTEFLANMSHEIRTPLNGVLGLAQVLARGRLDPEQRRHLDGILTSGETLLAVVNDILDISKFEAGKVRLEAIAFRPSVLAGQVRDLLAEAARAKGLELRLEVDERAPAVIGDPSRLRQVIQNLVGNAIKFTQRGTVTLRLAVTPDGGLQLLRCEVVDTGIGIDPDKRRRLFERFTQADSSTTRRFGGTGLGLAIVKQVIDLMGGRIGVDGAPGRGSTFWFEVALPAAGEAPVAGKLQPAAAASALRRLRVLAAEDNAINRTVLSGLLVEHHDLTLVENGLEALNAVRAAPPDVVLMDVQMPVMDGPAALAAIRAQESGKRRVPVVALTANSMPGDRERYLAAGFDDYLAKPIVAEELAAALGRIAGQGVVLAETAAPLAGASPDAAQDAALADLLSDIGKI